jgi:hypothetical protein
LTYLNNRYLDPTTGIFLSVDPLVSVTGEPYLYASGNPTTLSDPTGLMPDGFSGLSVSHNEFGGWTVGSWGSRYETNWRNQTVSGWDRDAGQMSFPAGSMQANVARQRGACYDSYQPFMCMAAAMTGGGMDAASAESLALDIAWALEGSGGPSLVDSGGVVADEWGNFVQDTIVTLGVSAAAKWILGFGGAAASETAATVFRGDGRALAEIFEGGMSARNPAMSLAEHLAGGNGFISATNSRFVANGFAVQNGGFVYVIDDVGQGTAVSYGPGFRHLIGEQEVVFTRIEPSQIRGAFGLDGSWFPNPNYGAG